MSSEHVIRICCCHVIAVQLVLGLFQEHHFTYETACKTPPGPGCVQDS